MINWIGNLDYSTVLVRLSLVFCAYVGLSALYNVFLHPLRKYPGPRLWAAFRFPQVLVRLRGVRPYKLLELHKKHGSVVRVGPDQLSFVDPVAWRQIYGFDYGRYTFKKHARQYSSWDDTHNILDAVGKNHNRVRRALLPAFTDRSVKEMEPLFHKHVDRFVEYLSGAQQTQQEVDLSVFYAFTTTDIVTDLASIERPYLLETQDRSQIVFATSAEYWLVQVMSAFRYWPTADYIFRRMILTPMLVFLQSGKMQLDSIEKRDRDRKDLWSLAQKAEDGSVNLAKNEIKGNAEILTIAGAETTSTTLTALTWFALKKPDTARQLAAEIRRTFANPDDITFTSIQSLTYVNACLKESLRLHAPLSGSLLRITPAEGASVCGEALPGGVEVSVSQYAMGLLPTHWQDADSFIPERWIEPEKTRFASDRREASQAFSVGPQSCIGERLAMHQARLILAKMLWHFDISLCDEHMNWADQKEMIVWARRPLAVKVHKRLQ